MRYLYPGDIDEGGEAGDTGSAAHVAVANFHRGKEPAECIEAMQANLPKYPRADLLDAADLFLKYASDNRNRTAELILIEHPIAFAIAPLPEDPTQTPIQVIGTLDQVRRINGKPRVYDFKTSKKDPMDLLLNYTYQIAGYCVGASVLLNEVVEPGAIILPRQYKDKDTSTANVFWHFSWSFKDIEDILYVIRQNVAQIRSGKVWHVPGKENCDWCHAKSPDLCLPKLQSTLKLIRA